MFADEEWLKREAARVQAESKQTAARIRQGQAELPPVRPPDQKPAPRTKRAPTPRPSANGTDDGEGKPHLTDTGNGRRFRDRHGADVRYCDPWGKWLVWDGKRWRPDDTQAAKARAKETVLALFAEAAQQIKEIGKRLKDAMDDEERMKLKARLAWWQKILAFALRSEAAPRINAMLDLARSEPGLPVLPEDLDHDPFLLNVTNGTIDLRRGELHPHRREDLLTKLAPVEFDPQAACPLWARSLARWMDDNADLTTYLQRVVGHGLTGDVSEQCLWFFHGSGANGKSTFLTTILAMLGDYGMQAVSELLMVKHNETHPTERADLFGRRFVATIETEQGKRMAESLMKQVTGGDKIRARRMRQDFFEFNPTHKIVLAANHRPRISGTDHAVWRRIKLVPFTVTIPEEEKDKTLPDKLRAELPGILAWAVRGCLDWQRDGLAEPDEVRQATSEYQAEQDTVQQFLAECCFIHSAARIRASALLDAYQRWSGDRLMTLQGFGQRLREKGFESKRGHGGGYFWHGISLPAQQEGEPG